jgi:hypothetical protein
MPAVRPFSDDAFQRAVRDFEQQESRRLFGESASGAAPVSAVETLAPPVLENSRLAHDDIPDEGGWARTLTYALDPAFGGVVLSLAVWVGLGIFAVRQLVPDTTAIRQEVVAAKADAEQARTALAALSSQADQWRMQAESTAQAAEIRGSEIARLSQSLAAADDKLRAWEFCFGSAPAKSLIQLEIPASGDQPAWKLCLAPPPAAAETLDAGQPWSQEQVNQFVANLLQRIGHPAEGAVDVKIRPDATSPGHLVYRYELPKSPVNVAPDEGGLQSIPANATFQVPRD